MQISFKPMNPLLFIYAREIVTGDMKRRIQDIAVFGFGFCFCGVCTGNT